MRLALILLVALLAPAFAADRKQAHSLMEQGNWKEAQSQLTQLIADPQADPDTVADDLNRSSQCLANLGDYVGFDAAVEDAVKIHGKNPKLLSTAAQLYLNAMHNGTVVSGKFERGYHRGGTARYVDVYSRDRARALQLLVQAVANLANQPPSYQAQIYLQLANTLIATRWGQNAWALGVLTNLEKLPDYDEPQNYYGHQDRGAPVDEKGDPLFHPRPASWETAQNDGQRWRFALAKAAEVDPNQVRTLKHRFADFLRGQFDVQTLRAWGASFGRLANDEKVDANNPFALRGLGEDETIARLASGPKRFKLPDEFNFIKIWKDLADQGDPSAMLKLGEIFENRMQYPRAAEWYKKAGNAEKVKQITDPWGTLEQFKIQPAGPGATVDFRFRNASNVKFTARAIDVERLIRDAKEHLKSKPREMRHERVDVGNIGYSLLNGDRANYLGEQVAAWDLKLEPRPEHLDRRIVVTTPLSKGGAYFLEAQVEGGNRTYLVVWITDLAIVKKTLDRKVLYYVTDAKTGVPAASAKLELFGYHVEWRDNWIGRGQRQHIETHEVSVETGPDGTFEALPGKFPERYTWMVQAKSGNRAGWLGWTGHGFGSWYDSAYNQQRAFFASDRPVYRPGHVAKFKFWLNQAQYDREGKSPYAGRRIRFQLTDPKGETTNIGDVTLDDYGGGDGSWTIPADATLGQYTISTENESGSGTIRVEEYKKPEFEVAVDAPSDPVMLGEKFEAKIVAKYLFGAPVKEGKIKYKVTRSDHDATWYPWAPWDWYYGRGYWWFGCDYVWYPGWFEWGCKRPVRQWFRHMYGGWAPPQQPEIVAENEAEIGEDGTVKVEIDTALAKATMGDTDHKYEITAEVTDKSRRTITGSGSVLVARQAFKVYAWLDNGHYRVGDAIEAHFNAQTVDGKPVAGAKGELKLFRLKYDAEGTPTETEVQTWDLPTGADGTSRQQLKASETGQYRLSYKVTDAKSHTIEGGYVFVVGGEGFDGGDFRFNDLELTADKKQYAPGESVRLRVNTNQRDTTVLLFVRAANGVCQEPQVLTLKGKSATVDVPVVKKDMPNMFIEALTVSNAKVHQEMLEVVVPPEDRVLNVKVTPAAEQVKPGAKTKVTIELTQADGKPYVGSLLVTMYDKAVEYISGGSNVGDIRELFWKWRREHHPQRETNLDRQDGAMVKNGERGMQYLGVFGQFAADTDGMDDQAMTKGSSVRRKNGGGFRDMKARAMAPGRGGGGPDMEMAEGMAAPAPMAAMAGNFAAKAEAAPMEADSLEASGAAPAPPPPGQAPAAATVRTNFADTAFWGAAIQTDAQGRATVEVEMPESLTTWKTKVWAMADGCRVGQADAQVVTSKNVLVRLQAPRFFVEKDEVVLSGNVHNYLKTDQSVQAVLELEGGTLEPMEKDKSTQTVQIKAGGEARVDWRVKVVREGKAVVRMKALTAEESDAMQLDFPVLVHGMLKTESFCGVIKPDGTRAEVKLNVPAERKPEQSRLEIRYSPTLAMAMVDALPYLVEYPYGCTEQTLNRFLPTVLTQKVLLQMGVKLSDVSKKITNLNAQEIGDDQKRAKDWERMARTHRWYDGKWVPRNPVFEESVVAEMIKAGVDKLVAMQLSDGGWGWFSGYGEHSSAHITSLVVHSLQVARFDDAKVPSSVLERGLGWLESYQAEELRKLNLPEKDPYHKSRADELDAFVCMVLADGKRGSVPMRERLYADRNTLAVYAKAMLGLALHRVKDTEKRDMVIRNIDQFLVEDAENQTAYLKLPADNAWWYWYGSEYEAQGYYLKLLAAVKQTDKASRLVKYLLNNRKNATYWNSTRDTAIVIEAFADYIAASGEDKPDMQVEILVDGKSAKTVKISGDNLFTYDNKLVLTGDAVTTGAHTIELKKTGTGPLYWNAYLTNFTQEDKITKAGLEVKVERAVYKLVREDATRKAPGDRGQVLEQKVEKYRREPLADGATLKSGELVEVEMTIESKNDYEYILVEDPKAAGFEATEVRSGYNGNDMGAYVEFRDQKVCFFVPALARGKHSVSYRLRAEIPGKFSALPSKISAMYAPELKGNSDEIKLNVED